VKPPHLPLSGKVICPPGMVLSLIHPRNEINTFDAGMNTSLIGEVAQQRWACEVKKKRVALYFRTVQKIKKPKE
jgi:hypothetical protein